MYSLKGTRMTDSTKKKHFTFRENPLASWKPFEKIWLFVFLSVIIATTVYFSATGTDYTSTQNVLLNWVISPISAISGLFCVVLAAKGKYSNWIWGVVNRPCSMATLPFKVDIMAICSSIWPTFCPRSSSAWSHGSG